MSFNSRCAKVIHMNLGLACLDNKGERLLYSYLQDWARSHRSISQEEGIFLMKQYTVITSPWISINGVQCSKSEHKTVLCKFKLSFYASIIKIKSTNPQSCRDSIFITL